MKRLCVCLNSNKTQIKCPRVKRRKGEEGGEEEEHQNNVCQVFRVQRKDKSQDGNKNVESKRSRNP